MRKLKDDGGTKKKEKWAKASPFLLGKCRLLWLGPLLQNSTFGSVGQKSDDCFAGSRIAGLLLWTFVFQKGDAIKTAINSLVVEQNLRSRKLNLACTIM